MPLQTRNLWMLGLGTVGDVPPNSLQPPLHDGMHLRWTFDPARGVPWFGYYLLRRDSGHRPIQGCISNDLKGHEPGPWPSTTFPVAFGTLSSDQPLVLTADFDPVGVAELDLARREAITLRITAGDEAFIATVTIGFRRNAGADGGKVELLGRYQGIVVARTVAVGQAGEVVTATLEAAAIDEVIVAGADDAALVDLCIQPLAFLVSNGWKPVESIAQPICLPVAAPGYPCPTAPASFAAAEALGLSRVRYGPSTVWAGAPFADLHDRLRALVIGGPPPGGAAMSDRFESIMGSPPPPPEAGGAIVAPTQRPLDLLLLASLNAAIAEILGLACLDAAAVPGMHYDYVLLADHDGSLGSVGGAVDFLSGATPNFSVVDGFLLLNVAVGPAPPLDPPAAGQAVALPGSTIAPDDGGPVIDGTNNVGLTWDRQQIGTVLAPGAPVLYHVWRAALGDDETPKLPTDDDFGLITKDGPLPVARAVLNPPSVPSQPDDWPPFALQYLDRALADGWYAYRVSAIDLFGRHSANGPSAAWHQWGPAPVPRPWYYRDPPGDQVLDPGAIRLLDKLAPPPPPAVEAFALAPEDPTVRQDAVWQSWRASLSTPERDNVVGLRVRWRWDAVQQRQAPDTREFRVYVEPAPANTLRGRVTDVAAAGATESVVTTNITHTQGVDAFAGTTILVGGRGFAVVGSDAVSPLRLRVRNIGAADDVAPASRERIAVSIPAGHALYTDLSGEAAWARRMAVVGFDEHVTVVGDERQYELLLPLAGSADRAGLDLPTTLDEPVATALVGVTAADDKLHTPDPRGDPARFGNESRIGGPATVLRVRRVAPDPPPVLPDSPRLFASPADYHDQSRFTVRWTPAPGLRVLVSRALDDAVVRSDRALRPRPPLSGGDGAQFPPDWSGVQRDQIAAELNGLNADSTPGAYARLSNDALRVLAALPGIERAFTQVTPQPLDPEEPDPSAPDGLRWRRVGPDVAADALDPGLRAFVDTLDGRAVNRWFYRCAYVDEVYNVGPLGLSTPPVWLPNVTAPRAPILVRIRGGERLITLEWSSNREPDLVRYEIYRADDDAQAGDLRRMTLVHTEPVAAGDPADRPPTLTWTDQPVPGLVTFGYRVAAIDDAGNRSEPSPAQAGRAHDTAQPVVPTPSIAWVEVAGTTRAQIRWTSADEVLVQTRPVGGGTWIDLSQWRPAGTVTVRDPFSDPTTAVQYRLRARRSTGAVALGTPIVLAAQ